MIEVMLPQGHQLSHLGPLGYVYPPRKQELAHVGLKCPVHQATSQCWMYQHVFTFLFHSVFLRNLYTIFHSGRTNLHSHQHAKGFPFP